MIVTRIAGAADVLLPDGSRVWFPPGYLNPRLELPASACRWPYWTAGPKCEPGRAGPLLTKLEILALVGDE